MINSAYPSRQTKTMTIVENISPESRLACLNTK